ncbi:DUF58 domain-containing protein [Agromyces archimandritae]|uniref:DUF58 domain-containing protein n=1 Tax=Agromyces archimandritae TaxID=2781962 RepID=A0A975IP00_9MICO|nr:DUF58 domain-containing protein [Agromyces archimandritae]QTX05138.1 DUF58 domain-containing protein [Agromyces archimandritae]
MSTGAAPRRPGGGFYIVVDGLVDAGRRTRSVAAAAGRAVRSVVTPTGVAVAGGGLASLVLWAWFGWVEGLVIGAGVAAMLVVSAVLLFGRNGAGLVLGLPQERVVVGDPASVRITGRRGSGRGGNVEIPVGEEVVRRMLPGGAVDVSLEVPAVRRGVVSVGPVRSVRGDPFGLMRRELVRSGEAVLYVHPRTIALPTLSTGFLRDLEGAQTRDLTASDVAFHALREYVPGDDRRHIHWRSTARTGTFMVRQYEETRRSHLVVLLDAGADAYADDEEFELAVSVAASLGSRAIRDARSLGALVTAPGARAGAAAGTDSAVRSLPTVSPERLLDAMCGVERDEEAAGLPEAARAVADTMPGVSLACLVTGSLRGTAELRQAARRLPNGVEVVAVECVPAAAPTVRAAGGLTVRTIGTLAELRAMLQRTASS